VEISGSSITDAYVTSMFVSLRDVSAWEKKFNNVQLHHTRIFETLIFVAGGSYLGSMMTVFRTIFRLHRFVDVLLTDRQIFHI
jgi:hypothetical protein